MMIVLVSSKRGITMALVVSGDSMVHATQEVDRLGVVANLEVLFAISSDLSKNIYRPFLILLIVITNDLQWHRTATILSTSH